MIYSGHGIARRGRRPVRHERAGFVTVADLHVVRLRADPLDVHRLGQYGARGRASRRVAEQTLEGRAIASFCPGTRPIAVSIRLRMRKPFNAHSATRAPTG